MPQAITNARIIAIRTADKLSRSNLALITGYSRSYVDNWLVDPESPNWREAPANAVRLLELETGRRTASFVPRAPVAVVRVPALVGNGQGEVRVHRGPIPPLVEAVKQALRPKRKAKRVQKRTAKRAAKKAQRKAKRRG